MVSNVATDRWQATVDANSTSDHWPVTFGALRGSAGPRTLTISADRNGGNLTALGANRNGTHVVAYNPRLTPPGQEWQLVPVGATNSAGSPLYRIKSVRDLTKCMDVVDGQKSHIGSYFHIWNCHKSGNPQNDSQNFTLVRPFPNWPNLTELRDNGTGSFAYVPRPNYYGEPQCDGGTNSG
jgi:hypothetical protein